MRLIFVYILYIKKRKFRYVQRHFVIYNIYISYRAIMYRKKFRIPEAN